MNPVIPGPVPVPLPAPPGLLEFLLVFTFILHLLAMDFLLGGVIILAISGFLGRRDSRHHELTRRVARALPPVTAFTITLGVAPLLFLQLVYGQLFYTSSVLMAWYWLAVVLLVLLGYYGVYWYHLQHDPLGPKARLGGTGYRCALSACGLHFYAKYHGHAASSGFLLPLHEREGREYLRRGVSCEPGAPGSLRSGSGGLRRLGGRAAFQPVANRFAESLRIGRGATA